MELGKRRERKRERDRASERLKLARAGERSLRRTGGSTTREAAERLHLTGRHPSER